MLQTLGKSKSLVSLSKAKQGRFSEPFGQESTGGFRDDMRLLG